MTEREAPAPADAETEIWCRLETETGGAGALPAVRRVHIMRANGEILASWPPGRFEPELVERMRSGHIRAFVKSGDGVARVSLRDLDGSEVFSAAI